jgi:cell division transport system permease protein
VRSWLRHHRDALAAAVRKIAAQKAAGVLNALVIGIALSLPAGGYALLDSLRSATAGATLEPQISVFMRVETKRPETEALGANLKADARLREVRFVPREQALKELQATEGLADVVAALNRNPLPDAFVLRPKSAEPAALGRLAEELRALPGVAQVQADAT